MNKISRYVLVVFALASMLLGACAGVAPSAPEGSKVQADSISYTGTIESINGSQWVVNGQTITVDPAVINDGPFNVGDVVKVEVQVAPDGSVTVTRVEVPTQDDLSQLPELGDDNSNNANSNDINGNDDNSNNANGNDDNSNQANGNDSNSNGGNGNGDNSNGNNEVFGVVQAITSTSITIDGQVYVFQPNAEIKGAFQPGDFVKLHLVLNADGTFSVREMEMSDPSQADNGNGNDDNGNDSNSNGGNGNDDNGNDNSNSGGGGNDNSGGGNDNGGGGGNDDNGGGGNDNGGGGGNDNGGNGNG
ncbi:MAG: hypothetical protein HOP27_05120 [Anaerolineales bacterium]|nr:hypothetical protein [Anaerolineales bacterium]